jgi:integrase
MLGHMASIHKDPRGKSKYWYCCYTTAEGTRRMVSTKEEDEGKAKIICTGWQEAEGLVRGGQATEQRIQEMYNETLKRVGLREIKSPTIKAWTTDWLASKRKISKASKLAYEQAIREFLTFLGVRQNAPIESITERDVEGFVDHLLKEGRSASTVNKLVRKYLSGAFEKARKLGKIKYNPVAATDPLPSDSTVKDVFSAEQVAQLAKAAEGDWRGAILLAYGSGARLQDVCNFRWDAIDTENGILTFRERKTKKQAVVGLHPDFVDWLIGQLAPEKSDACLFPSLANRSGAGSHGLGAEFDAIMRRARIEGRVLKERNGKGRKVRSLTFHSFRHTAASSVFNSEAIKEVQRRVTNHARGGVLDKYTHADLDLIRQAVTLIPRLPKNE